MKKKYSTFTLAEGASHGAMSDSNRKIATRIICGSGRVTSDRYLTSSADAPLYRKFGFTLAEVLITLGIIGVVAAMTMPTLMSKYREEVTMNKLKKFYTTMAQVQLRSIADHGEVEAWDWVPSGGESNNQIVLDWYNKYFGQYLNDCKIIDRKVLKDNELVDGGITVQLSDGSVFNISGFSGGYLHFSYFTNYKTFMDETAVEGKDAFLFGFGAQATARACLKRFNGYICHIDEDRLKNDSRGGCYVKNPSNGNVYCTRLLQLNGWRVPKDYPFKF